jgi:hypothetical protein
VAGRIDPGLGHRQGPPRQIGAQEVDRDLDLGPLEALAQGDRQGVRLFAGGRRRAPDPEAAALAQHAREPGRLEPREVRRLAKERRVVGRQHVQHVGHHRAVRVTLDRVDQVADAPPRAADQLAQPGLDHHPLLGAQADPGVAVHDRAQTLELALRQPELRDGVDARRGGHG